MKGWRHEAGSRHGGSATCLANERRRVDGDRSAEHQPAGWAEALRPSDGQRCRDQRVPANVASARAGQGLPLAWMLEGGEIASMKELAESEATDNSYVGRIINLTLLAPEIIAGILDDTIPDVQIDRLGISPPLLWSEQRRLIRMET